VQAISLGMILAGTIGNMVDRVSFGAVRDFIKVYYRSSEGAEKVWPLFNLADSFICVGVFLLSIEMLFFEEKKTPSAAPAIASGPATPPAPAEPLPGPGP
jgi:signal peptidase II